MGDRSAIQWTDASWNPIRGCSRVSEGCRNCYAERIAARFTAPGQAFHGVAKVTSLKPYTGRWTGEVRFVEEALALPLRWTKPRRIFVNSMSDLFHEKVADEWIDRIFAVMALCPQHTFQVLTKRPERMLAYFQASIGLEERVHEVARIAEHMAKIVWDARGSDYSAYIMPVTPEKVANRRPFPGWPLPNVHLGVSTENQATFDERVELLSRTPAAVRFVSMEPLLEEIDPGNAFDDPPAGSPYGPLDWIIVGGESGPGARPCHLAWIRSVVQQAKAAGVPCFVKQLGSRPVHEGARWWIKDRKGGDPTEWPEDLRVREFPR